MTVSVPEPCTDAAILNQWHPIAAEGEVPCGAVSQITLLGYQVSYSLTSSGEYVAWRTDTSQRRGDRFEPNAVTDPLPVLVQYGYLWSSLGTPPAQLFEIPQYAEPDRRNIHAGTIGVACSAPRAVENFLDMGHFPFVHTGILGIEPHTEVREYQVEIDDKNEIWATDCVFYQPQAAATASGGQMSDYTYRVPHPYCVLLYKSCPLDPTRMDVIGLFVRSVASDHIEANMFLSLIDDKSSNSEIKIFQQTIFGQDKPILENQYPKLLPLDPRFETPIRADSVAIAYRRWLTNLGVTYGVIPAA